MDSDSAFYKIGLVYVSFLLQTTHKYGIRRVFSTTATIDLLRYFKRFMTATVTLFSAGSFTPSRVIGSLSNDQAMRVVSDSSFNANNRDAVCRLSDIFVYVFINILTLSVVN